MSAAEVIAFPDVEALVVSYLRPLLDVPVVVTIPNPRPPSLVRIVRTGGPRQGVVVDLAQITCEAWAPSTVAAAALAAHARALIGAMTGQTFAGVHVGRVAEFAGPGNLPDPTSSTPRYSWTVVVPVRGAAIEPVVPPAQT